MGQGLSSSSSCPFTKEELDEYEELTYLSRWEILKAYSKFCRIQESSSSSSSNGGPARSSRRRTTVRSPEHFQEPSSALRPGMLLIGAAAPSAVTCEKVRQATDELRLNPFGDRICQVFSSSSSSAAGKANNAGGEGLGDMVMTFDDYLDMYSALSERAGLEVKIAYAFRIYDFDGDGVVGKDDVRAVVDRLLYDDDKHLTRAEITGLIDHLLKEVDNDEDGAICYPEFQQAMQKCPDFAYNFKMFI